jgi:hypothetical protein
VTIGGGAVAFLLLIVFFVIRGISGHKRHGDGSENLDSWGSGGTGID